MKKYVYRSLFLSFSAAFLVMNASLVAAEETTVCAQVMQAAVNQRGECRYFPSPCDTPEDWKKIDSCNNIQSASFGSRTEDTFQRRYGREQNWAKYRENADNETTTVTGYQRRIGSGRLTRRRHQKTTDADRSSTVATSEKRTSTRRYAPSRYYLNNNDERRTDFLENREKNSAYKSAQRGHQRLARSAGAVREGNLSNKAKWATQTETHFKRNTNYGSRSKVWQSYASQLQEKVRKNRAQTRASRLENKNEANRNWRRAGIGKRLRGNFDGTTTETNETEAIAE